MRLLIITHVLHKKGNTDWFAYAPYVREMNLWLKYVNEVEIVAPLTAEKSSVIDIAYKHDNIIFTKIPSIAFVTVGRTMLSLLSIPFILLQLFKACKRADHIHLRCPGNIGLFGCIVQILFPKKIKTAKYAGNWDPEAKQPLSYKLQKKMLSNTTLTKNMTAVVYGKWKHQTKNIKPFFTATFKNEDRIMPAKRSYSSDLKFVFIGSLVEGKRPLFAIQIIESLVQKGHSVSLDIYGEGVLKEELQAYSKSHDLNDVIMFYGNQDSDTIKAALKHAHFSVLASKSEGWPKAIAEAMFFGVIPIATSISCVPDMLDNGSRGVLISNDLDKAIAVIEEHLKHEDNLIIMSEKALKWSQNYTLEVFEAEIKTLIQD